MGNTCKWSLKFIDGYNFGGKDIVGAFETKDEAEKFAELLNESCMQYTGEGDRKVCYVVRTESSDNNEIQFKWAVVQTIEFENKYTAALSKIVGAFDSRDDAVELCDKYEKYFDKVQDDSIAFISFRVELIPTSTMTDEVVSYFDKYGTKPFWCVSLPFKKGSLAVTSSECSANIEPLTDVLHDDKVYGKVDICIDCSMGDYSTIRMHNVRAATKSEAISNAMEELTEPELRKKLISLLPDAGRIILKEYWKCRCDEQMCIADTSRFECLADFVDLVKHVHEEGWSVSKDVMIPEKCEIRKRWNTPLTFKDFNLECVVDVTFIAITRKPDYLELVDTETNQVISTYHIKEDDIQ